MLLFNHIKYKTMKTIKLSVEQAKELYSLNKEYRSNLLSEFTDDELGIEPQKPILRDWDDIIKEKVENNIDRWHITPNGCIYKSFSILGYSHNDVPTEKHAKSMLAFAKLSILMNDLGDECDVDWSDDNQGKYVIISYAGNLDKTALINYWHFLAFKTEQMRDKFLAKHERLIKDYFMID